MREVHKILFKQKFLFLFVLGLLLKIVFVCASPSQPTFQRHSDQLAYEEAMAFLQGPLTDEKKEYLFTEEQHRKTDDEAINSFWEQFDNGDISEEQLQEKISSYEKTAEIPDNVWGELQRGYKYVQTDISKHYFIKENGWSLLIGTSSIDVVFFILIVLLAGISITYEYECGMVNILWASKFGRINLAVKKLLAVLGIGLSMYIGFEAINVICIGIRNGLPGPSYPIQSLMEFEKSFHSMKIVSVYFLSRLLQILGLVYIISLVLLVGTLSQKALPALFVGIISVLLPSLFFEGSDWLYRLPNPAGLLNGNGFFFCDVVSIEGDIMYKSLQNSAIFISVALSFLFSMLMIVLYCYFYQKCKVKRGSE